MKGGLMLVLGTPGFMPDPVRLIVVLSVALWLFLFILFIPPCLGTWLYRFVKSRAGLDPEGLYCAKCHFDVRGTASNRCSECGANLGVSCTHSMSHSGVTARGLRSPAGAGYRTVVYPLLAFGPAVFAVILFGRILPINDQHTLLVGLSLPGQSPPDTVTISVDSQRTWIGDYRLHQVNCYVAGLGATAEVNRSETIDAALIVPVWERLVSKKPLLLPLAERDRLKEEFIAVFLAACSFDEQAARSAVNRFQVTWEMWSRDEFHPWYTVMGIVTVITLMVWLLFRAQRDADKAWQAYAGRLSKLQKRLSVIQSQGLEGDRESLDSAG